MRDAYKFKIQPLRFGSINNKTFGSYNAFRINTERLSKMSYLLKNEKKQNMSVEFIKGFNILRTY